jgi:hypothetical protein
MNFSKKIKLTLLATICFAISSLAQNYPTPPTSVPQPVPANPYPPGLPSPVQPVPPPGLKTDTMSTQKPVRPIIRDTIRGTPQNVFPSDTTTPVPKLNKK